MLGQEGAVVLGTPISSYVGSFEKLTIIFFNIVENISQSF